MTMVLKFVTKESTKVYGPPYTKQEEAEFYSRNASGPVTVARGADARKAIRRPRAATNGHEDRDDAVAQGGIERPCSPGGGGGCRFKSCQRHRHGRFAPKSGHC